MHVELLVLCQAPIIYLKWNRFHDSKTFNDAVYPQKTKTKKNSGTCLQWYIFCKMLLALLCYNHASCKYWTWREDYPNYGSPQYCHLKDANSGLSYLEGVISGGKNCRGKDADLYQCFFYFSWQSQTTANANIPPMSLIAIVQYKLL